VIESGQLRLNARGDFFLDEDEVTHPRVLAMLRRELRRLPSGHYGYLLGEGEVRVEVEDAPYIIEAIHVEHEALLGSSSRERIEVLDPSRIEWRGEVPYAWLGEDRARLSPRAALTLGAMIEVEGEGLFLRLGGQRISLPGVSIEA
jgi:hypothetical protein